jgi:uncharacterized repeat protein (TIGR02543 family)
VSTTKGNFRIGAIALLALATTACQLSIARPAIGDLSVSAAPLLSGARTILPPAVDIATYRASGSGPSGASFGPTDSATGAFSFTDLPSGSWTIRVDGYGETSALIASGTAAVAVPAGGNAHAQIQLLPISGTGGLQLSVTGLSNGTVTSVAGTLTPQAGSPIAIDLAKTGDTASYSASGIAAGSYTLVLSIKNGTQDAAAPRTDTVLVYAAQTSVGTFALTSADFNFRVYYNGNGATSGSTPADASIYASGDTVTVSGNTGGLARTGYSFDGWSTTASGSMDRAAGSSFAIGTGDVTLYAHWASTSTRIIDHTYYDPIAIGYSDDQIAAAAALDVYFEHASTGRDIVGNSSTNSSTGTNQDGSETCGLALLYAIDNRFLCSRSSYEYGNSSSWFSTHHGLQDNMRGNPTPATKLSGFLGMSAAIRAAIDVAMFKFCWIDVWDGSIAGWAYTDGYVSNGASFAASMISQIQSLESANPGIVVPYWTMPLQTDQSYAQRQIYNDAIRAYCRTNNHWLIDIADLESYDSSSVHHVDGNGRELMYSAYATSDGGHLAAAGRLKMARAYWTLLAEIAKTR